MNRVQLEDCQKIGELNFIDWKQLKNTNVLITGSTGLIGSNLVNALAYNNKEKKLGIKLFLFVRDTESAKKLFDWTEVNIFPYELGTKLEINIPMDYIIHLASPTNSKFFTKKPVNTMLDNIEGTKAILEWAKKYRVKKFIYLSTMEVYGFPEKGHKVKENEIGAFETMKNRNSYPLAKIACEALCNSYYAQYGVPIVVLRATQTFGPGVKYDDERVFAYFMRCAIEKKDIVLKSLGLTERSYLYTGDAVSAILISLLKAETGQVYTIANPKTYCSIKDMATIVTKKIADGQIKIVYDIAENIEKLGYADTLFMDLDVEKLLNLGWYPTANLKTMFEKMIRGVQYE